MEKIKLSIKLKNRLIDLGKIEKAILKMSSSIDCTRRKFKEVSLILEELFTNVVNHGFNDNHEHDIDLTLSCDDKSLKIRMEDDGRPFDLTCASKPDTRCAIEKRLVGGLGVHFIKHFADECKYQRKQGKNIIELKKHIKDNGQKKESTNDSK
ncbi:MAG: ATP-binding protein [Desulfobacula sp.]|nr:ATP-binding protein [Desulfobacula sp.]